MARSVMVATRCILWPSLFKYFGSSFRTTGSLASLALNVGLKRKLRAKLEVAVHPGGRSGNSRHVLFFTPETLYIFV